MITALFILIILFAFLAAGLFFDGPTNERPEQVAVSTDIEPLILADYSASLDRRLQADQRKRSAINYLRTVDGEWS